MTQKRSRTLISVASWEERFLLGFERLNEKPFDQVIMFYYKEYMDRTASNRARIQAICKGENISLVPLSFADQQESWKTIYTTLQAVNPSSSKFTVDLTTMPRETIWAVFDLVENLGGKADYVYHRPERYHDKWLSRDPGKPRLAYKLAGLSQFGLPTKLLILTGYDADRVKQLMAFFEPNETLLGIQIGEQFDNRHLNEEKHKDEFNKRAGVVYFDVDAYSEDHGQTIIREIILPHVGLSNLVMSSLGPKLTAVALYKLHKEFPETALAYAPSNEFNPNYSKGIGASIIGEL